MKPAYKNLGKVCLTPDGYWDRQKEYERISVVTVELTGRSYISKKDVPAGVSISNQEYWQPISSAGYKDNNIIIINDTDDNGSLIPYTLQEAINTLADEDKVPGLILGFYGLNTVNSDSKYTWYLYQFNSATLDDWSKLSCWVSIYDNVDKFKGYFINATLLSNQYPFPIVGDFAYVGEDLEKAVTYICTQNGQWSSSNIAALQFADKYKSVYSKDVEEFTANVEETTADRAIKDASGNVITDTYLTRADISSLISRIEALENLVKSLT